MNDCKRKSILTAAAGLLMSGALMTHAAGIDPADASHRANPIGAIQTDSASTSSHRKAEPVTREEAGRLVVDRYGGTVKGVGSDDYHGKDAWEVEVRDSRQGRIEVKVEKSTGRILHMEQDD